MPQGQEGIGAGVPRTRDASARRTERARVPVYQGSENKSDVLNEGDEGRDVAVGFKLRTGTQEQQLPIKADPNDENRIVIVPDARSEDAQDAWILQQRENKLYLKQEDRELEITADDIANNEAIIPLNDNLLVEVLGFDPATREVILHKIQIPETDPPINPQEPKTYEVNLGPSGEWVQKTVSADAEEQMEISLTENAMKNIPQNRLKRWGRIIAYNLNPFNIKKNLFNANKEFYRQIWMKADAKEIHDARYGASNNISTRAAKHVQEMKEEEREVLRRMKLGEEGVKAGELGPTELPEGEMRDFVINQVLKPAVDRLQSGTTDENTIENQIQAQLYEFVKNNQDKQFIRDFFGKRIGEYGAMSEFYATDILETARKIIEDGRAQDFATGQLDNFIKVRIFRATWAEQTEIKRTLADKLLEQAEKHRLGAVINPATAGIIASAATFLATGAVAKGATAIATPVGGLLAGVAIGAARVNWDLKEYYKAVSRQAEAGKKSAPGTPREQREEIEAFLPNMATPDQMISGGGTELFGGLERASIDNLLARGEYEALARRYGEIRARLDFPHLPRDTRKFIFSGERQPFKAIGLIAYEERGKIEHGNLELVRKAVEIREALVDPSRGGMNPEDLNTAVTHWNESFMENRQIQEAAFARYRLGRVIDSAIDAAAIGGIMGLGTQELLAVAQGTALTGQTLVEKPFAFAGEHLTQVAHAQGLGGEVSIGATRELFQHPTNIGLNDHLQLAVDPNVAQDGARNATILDASGNKLPTPPIHLLENGRIAILGDSNNLPQEVKDLVGGTGWSQEASTNTWFDVKADIKDMLDTGRHDTFIHGDLTIDVNGEGGQGSISMTYEPSRTTENPTGFMILGKGEIDLQTGVPHITLDSDIQANSQEQVNTFQTELKQDAWNVDTQTVAGRDELVNVHEYLKEKGELSPTNRELWHDNDTPMHRVDGRWVGADGKELQFYHRVLPDGTIELDFSKMQSQLISDKWTNWDSTVDNQYNRLVHDIALQPDGTRSYNNFEIMITPNEQANIERLADVFTQNDHPELRAGLLHFAPDSEQAKMFFQVDQNGNPIRNQFGNFQTASYIEVSHLQDNGLRTILSTTQGEGVNEFRVQVPGHEVIVATPPGAIEYIPPETPAIAPPEAPPIIPIPFIARRPLEPIVMAPPEYPYYNFGYDLFRRPDGTPAILSDIIRFRSSEAARDSRIASLFPPRTPPISTATGAPIESASVEGEQALAVIHETFVNSPHVYVSLAGAIGDVAIDSAYLEGIRQYAEQLGAQKIITIIAPPNVVPLIQPLANRFGYEIVTEERYRGVDRARSLIDEQGEENALVFEFEHHTGRPAVELLPRNGLVVSDLFAASVGLYDNGRSGSERFTEFFSDLLTIPPNQRFSIKPRLDLPDNADQVYQELQTRHSIDTTKQQVALVVEASHQMKRYSLENWRTVVEEITRQAPNTQFNVVYNPIGGSYSEEQLRNVFGAVPNTHLISGTLMEQVVLLSRQNLVLSNDTGLAHVSAIVEGGPKVVSLHVPVFPPNVWITDTNRHEGIMTPFIGEFRSEEAVESRKLINKISPDSIARVALRNLQATAATPAQPAPPPTQPATPSTAQQIGTAFTELGSTVAQAARDKVREYTDEILRGGNSRQILQGLPQGWKDEISRRVRDTRRAIAASIRPQPIIRPIPENETVEAQIAAAPPSPERARRLQIEDRIGEISKRIQNATPEEQAQLGTERQVLVDEWNQLRGAVGRVGQPQFTPPIQPTPPPPQAQTLEAQMATRPEVVSGRFEVANATKSSSSHPERNEDAVISDSQHGFIGVFDGMGGQAAGNVASNIAQNTIGQVLKSLPANANEQQIVETLNLAWRNTQETIRNDERINPQHRSMDTTAVAVKIFTTPQGKKAAIAHVGDSRAYAILKDGTIRQLTEDDSVLKMAFSRGEIKDRRTFEMFSNLFDEIDGSEDIYKQIPDNKLAQYVAELWASRNITDGVAGNKSPHITVIELGDDIDSIFVTSDGVHDNLKKSQITEIAKRATGTQQLVSSLVNEARLVADRYDNQKSGWAQRSKPDDITAAAIKVSNIPTVVQTTAQPAQATPLPPTEPLQATTPPIEPQVEPLVAPEPITAAPTQTLEATVEPPPGVELPDYVVENLERARALIGENDIELPSISFIQSRLGLVYGHAREIAQQLEKEYADRYLSKYPGEIEKIKKRLEDGLLSSKVNYIFIGTSDQVENGREILAAWRQVARESGYWLTVSNITSEGYVTVDIHEIQPEEPPPIPPPIRRRPRA